MDNRFEIVHKEDIPRFNRAEFMIIRDKNTGVNYLCYELNVQPSLTVLVDKDGKPIVT